MPYAFIQDVPANEEIYRVLTEAMAAAHVPRTG